MNQTPRHRFRDVLGPNGWAALMAFLALVTPTYGDAFRQDRLWIENVAFETYEGGKLHYSVNGNPVSTNITKIDGLKMEAYPDLEKAEVALAEDKKADALASFQKARRQAREPWLKMWLDAKMIPLFDALDKGQEAANAYISLIETKAPVGFVENPPSRSVGKLDAEAKKALRPKFEALVKTVPDKSPAFFALKDLIDVSDPDAAAPVTPVTPTVEGQLPSVIPLPEFMITGQVDAITKQIARGSFGPALERVNIELQSTEGGKTSLRLYQRGLVQLYQAQAIENKQSAEAQKLYKEAGLDFMRIVIYFPTSVYAGPAGLEAAVTMVHIGRKDQARNLYEESLNRVDPKDEIMKKRLDDVQALIAGAE